MKTRTLWRPVIGQISAPADGSRLERRVSRTFCPITPIRCTLSIWHRPEFGNMAPKFDLVVINGTIVTASDIR